MIYEIHLNRELIFQGLPHSKTSASPLKTNRQMKSSKIITVSCKNQTKHLNVLSEKCGGIFFLARQPPSGPWPPHSRDF